MIPELKLYQLFYLKVRPRYTIYLESDLFAELIVDATYSNYFGTPIKTSNGSSSLPALFKTLDFEARCDETGAILNSSSIKANSVDNLVLFDIKLLYSRLEPYPITITAKVPESGQTFSASTRIYVLPSRNYGSAVKIDRLYGGSYIQNRANNYKGWYPIFPNLMFADAKVTIPMTVNFTYLDIYAELGFNMILIVPDGSAPEQSYNYTDLQKYWDRMDDINLFNIYSMQFAYQNRTRLETQVNMWKNRSTLYSYHIADEPDGWHHPIKNTKLAYDQIKRLDPYHPIQLVLNCQNFFFAEYSEGADIIIEDAYPIGTNPYHSILWDTTCNSTYGDCGIDNGKGRVSDVADRIDDIYFYQNFIEDSEWKPVWPTIQAFEKQDYWDRQPTSKEVINMAMLSLNHNTKGVSYWLYTNSYDQGVLGAKAFGKLLYSPEVIKFIFGSMATRNIRTTADNSIDVSAWVLGNEMMIGIVSMSSLDLNKPIDIYLPTTTNATCIIQQPYGNSEFTLIDNTISVYGMKGYEVNILIVSLLYNPAERKLI